MTSKRLAGIPTIIQCLRCSRTGRSEIILKKRLLNGHGSSLLKNLEYQRTGSLQQFLKEAGKKKCRAIMKPSATGKDASQILKAEFSKDQKKIISGRWEKQGRAALVPKFMLTSGMTRNVRKF